MPRILFFIAILGLIYLIFRQFNKNSTFMKCGKCNGKGYWEALRNREKCDNCGGSGRVFKY